MHRSSESIGTIAGALAKAQQTLRAERQRRAQLQIHVVKQRDAEDPKHQAANQVSRSRRLGIAGSPHIALSEDVT
jgi:hypothetical protein